ncbi:hypothetical protein ENBRE01_2177 [Enteropsectra breve]|nr:hypothetical protein ENBRE01_2177 [Enteropsectra breve]
MVWACFDYFGKPKLVFLERGIDSGKYQTVFKEHLLPFLSQRDNGQALFQQDNARPHIAKSSMMWPEANGIECIEWPAYSPDLNSIENLWGILVHRVYANGRQFDNEDQLKETAIKEWECISKDTLESLILSMRERIIDVLVSHGASTKY